MVQNSDDATKHEKIPKVARYVRKIISTGLIVGATYGFFKYDVNNKINNVINHFRGYAAYVTEDTGKKMFEAVHSNPTEIFPKFEASVRNYEAEVRNGSFDETLGRYQTLIDSVRSGESSGEYWLVKSKERLNGIKEKLVPQELEVFLERAELLIDSYRSEENKKEHAVRSAFDAVDYFNEDGFAAMRHYVTARMEPAHALQLNLEGVMTAPKEQRMYSMRRVFSTLTPEDQANTVVGLALESSDREKLARALMPYEASPFQRTAAIPVASAAGPIQGFGAVEYVQQPSSQYPLFQAQEPGSPSYLQSMGQRVKQTLRGIFQ